MADYDFRTLSPLDFEPLVRDLFNAEHGCALATFAPGPDGGVDLSGSCSQWNPVVVQCKHTPDLTRAGLVRSARRETAKWTQRDCPDAYFLATSADISPAAEFEVLLALAPLPVPPDGIWHRGRLNGLLTKHAHVERTHFKLWLASSTALQEIVNAGQWQRSEELLQRVQDRVRLYVFTPAYTEALSVLEDQNAVVITGPPGAGKSTVAEMLLLSAWHEGWTIVDVTANVEEAWRRLRQPHEKLLYYYDDFLGQTDIAEVGKNEAASIGRFLEKIRQGDGSQRLILTTRDQVLAQARSGPDDRLRRLEVDRGRAQVRLKDLGRLTRAHILFNHLHFTITEPSARRRAAADDRYLRVIDHPNFSPRIVESATLRRSFESVEKLYDILEEALDNPDELWHGSFNQLSPVAASLLLQLATSPRGAMPLSALRMAASVSDPRSWDQALRVLEGSWIRLTATANGPVDEASLFDPSRRDFLLGLLRKDGYLAQVLDKVVGTDQIHYIVRLGGLMTRSHGSLAGAPGDNGIGQALMRDTSQLLSATLRCAQDELNELAVREARGLSGRTNRWGPIEGWRWQPTTIRAQILRRVAEILWLSEGQQEVDWLMTQVAELTRSLKDGAGSDSEELLLLAQSVGELEDKVGFDQTGTRPSEDIFVAGAERIENGDDVDRYYFLSDEWKTARVEQAASAAISEALDAERDGIRQQDDAGLVRSWIDETRERAERHNIPMDFESLEEFLEELEARPVSRERIAPISGSGKNSSSSEDAAIAEVFARMNLESDEFPIDG